MAKCSVCGGDGPMIVMHSSCLHDLLMAINPDILPCNLCGNIEACISALDTPCRDLFRLDPAKVQTELQEVKAND